MNHKESIAFIVIVACAVAALGLLSVSGSTSKWNHAVIAGRIKSATTGPDAADTTRGSNRSYLRGAWGDTRGSCLHRYLVQDRCQDFDADKGYDDDDDDDEYFPYEVGTVTDPYRSNDRGFKSQFRIAKLIY